MLYVRVGIMQGTILILLIILCICWSFFLFSFEKVQGEYKVNNDAFRAVCTSGKRWEIHLEMKQLLMMQNGKMKCIFYLLSEHSRELVSGAMLCFVSMLPWQQYLIGACQKHMFSISFSVEGCGTLISESTRSIVKILMKWRKKFGD